MLSFTWHSHVRRRVGGSSRIRLPGLKLHHFLAMWWSPNYSLPVCLSFPLYTAGMLASLASVGEVHMWWCVGKVWPKDQHRVNRA